MAECAHSLTLACVLDQRGQWLSRRTSSLDRIQAQQSDRFHELLHQLRSPLTALKTFGKLLIKRLPSEDQNQLLVANMLRESDRLKGMLQNFSDVIDLDPDLQQTPNTSQPMAPLGLPAGRDDDRDAPQPLALLPTSISDDPFSLRELLTDLTETAKLLAREGQVNFEYDDIGTLPEVSGDRITLRETIGNVIDNALKYTPAGGRVRIQSAIAVPHCHRQWSELLDPVPGAVEDALLQRSPNSQRPQFQPHVMIHIQDSGLGISTHDLQQLFSRRFRGDKTDSEIPGTGLGLAIARQIIEDNHGGSLEMNSELGKGTEFCIRLPTRLGKLCA